MKRHVLSLLQAKRLQDAKILCTEITNGHPDDVDAWCLLGSVNELLGQTGEAAASFRRALAISPDCVPAHSGLGCALRKEGNIEGAVSCFKTALIHQPDHYGILNNTGNALMAKGAYNEAEIMYRQAIEKNPDFAEVRNNLGKLLLTQGKHTEAIVYFRRALEINPDYTSAWVNLGDSLHKENRLDEALQSYTHAVQLKPDRTEAHYAMGRILEQQGKSVLALQCYQQAIVCNPNHFPALNNAGYILHRQGNLEDAIHCYREARRINPDFVEATNNLGNIYLEQGKTEDAIYLYRQALQIEPEYAEAKNNLGTALLKKGLLTDAMECYKDALGLKHDYVDAHANLGNIYTSQGLIDKAIACYQKALEIDSKRTDIHSNLVYCLNFKRTEPEVVFNAHRNWSAQHEKPIRGSLHCKNDSNPDRVLRVGYISPDLHNHSVASFFEPLLSHHDRKTVETFCYSDVPVPDATSRRLQQCCSHWRNIFGGSHQQVAELVTRDSIDILVDLAGHTARNRLPVFAEKPAPIQVNYLGYPNTTGLSAMDYRLTDQWADSPGNTEQWHSETLVRLPRGFLCFQPPEVCPLIEPPPVLASGTITFGSFNTLSKISPEVVATWAAILQRVPGSRMLFKNKSLVDDGTKKHYEMLFNEHGIAAERLEFLGWIQDQGGHLASYQRIDIALDTFPYNGTTTSCEALWMGVPVITSTGETHAGRVGFSLLSQLGLNEWAGSSPENYIELAVHLAQDHNNLLHWRKELRNRLQNSSLCDGPGFASDVEAAYRTMWRTWCMENKGSRQR